MEGPKVFVYVGTYSTAVDGGGSNGKGIYLFEMNRSTGELSLIKLAAEGRNASWLSLDPSGRYLYAANEVADFAGKSGAVSAYAVNRSNGNLQLLNVVSSEGAGPAHLSVDGSGKYVFVANYAGGTVAVLPILKPVRLAQPPTFTRTQALVGPKIPSSAPPGSFAFSGHDKPHAHMIHADPSNRFVLQTDLGQDRIYVSAFDPAPVNCLPQRLPLFLCLRGMGHVTSPFTAMGAGYIRFRKRRQPWCFFISIRRLERFVRSKPSPPYRRALREQPSLQRSCSRPMGNFSMQPTGSTIRSLSSLLTAKAGCITWARPQPWAITRGTYKWILADPFCMHATNAAIVSRPFASTVRRDC